MGWAHEILTHLEQRGILAAPSSLNGPADSTRLEVALRVAGLLKDSDTMAFLTNDELTEIRGLAQRFETELEMFGLELPAQVSAASYTEIQMPSYEAFQVELDKKLTLTASEWSAPEWNAANSVEPFSFKKMELEWSLPADFSVRGGLEQTESLTLDTTSVPYVGVDRQFTEDTALMVDVRYPDRLETLRSPGWEVETRFVVRF